MNPPIVIYRKNLKTERGSGNRLITRIIDPEKVSLSKLQAGIIECGPGDSPHRWHMHTRDSLPEYDLVYPKGFEEFYYIIKGDAKVQWKTSDGTVHEESAAAGDTVYMPVDIMEHQVLNSGKDVLAVLYAITPPVKRIGK